jgi:isopenicillin N synthase-like dioxygenase
MLLDADGNLVDGNTVDSAAGLYAMSRHSELLKVNIPPTHMGFQIGETAQIHSGGALQATPHAVRGARIPGISRESFAVFMEPMWDEPMVCPRSVDPAAAQSQSSAKNLPSGVPPLSSRWRGADDSEENLSKAMTFGDFSDATLNAYY